jgi:arylsulfatase A
VPVSGVDVLPTLCEVAGVAVPSDRVLDGISVATLFAGKKPERTKALFWEYLWAPAGPQVALRDGAWKILARFDAPRPRGGEFSEAALRALKSASLIDFELYNLESDSAERSNLASAEPARLAELRSKLEEFHRSVRNERPEWPPFQDPGYEQRTIKWPDYMAKPLAP